MERINKQRVYNYYNKKNKWLGIIDYKTLFSFLAYFFTVTKVVFWLNFTIEIKLYIILNLIIPFVIFILLNINEDSVIDKFLIILNFILKSKIYIKSEYYAKLGTKYVENVDNLYIVKSTRK